MQAVQLYDTYEQMLQDCDRQIEVVLNRLACHEAPEGVDGLRAALIRLCGVDLTRIDGIGIEVFLTVMAEVGPDLSRFPTTKQFASWLGVCSGTKISGGRTLSGTSKRSTNRVAQALRMAAQSLRRSQSALGAYFRRMCGRLDKAKAITATAHKLARLICMMLTKGVEYVDRGQAYEEERHRERKLHHLNRTAASMGFRLEPLAQTEQA